MATQTNLVAGATPSAPLKTEAPIQGVKHPITDLSKVWILYYRHGMNTNCSKCFVHEGDFKSAVERSKKHCEIMGYRWIFIRPFVVDLMAEEIEKVQHG